MVFTSKLARRSSVILHAYLVSSILQCPRTTAARAFKTVDYRLCTSAVVRFLSFETRVASDKSPRGDGRLDTGARRSLGAARLRRVGTAASSEVPVGSDGHEPSVCCPESGRAAEYLPDVSARPAVRGAGGRALHHAAVSRRLIGGREIPPDQRRLGRAYIISLIGPGSVVGDRRYDAADEPRQLP